MENRRSRSRSQPAARVRAMVTRLRHMGMTEEMPRSTQLSQKLSSVPPRVAKKKRLNCRVLET